MASAAGMRANMVARTLAGEVTGFAIVRAVFGRGEQPAGFGLADTGDEEGGR
jgi:hypothetical protein